MHEISLCDERVVSCGNISGLQPQWQVNLQILFSVCVCLCVHVCAWVCVCSKSSKAILLSTYHEQRPPLFYPWRSLTDRLPCGCWPLLLPLPMGYCPQGSSVCTPCFQGFGLRTKNSPCEHRPRIRASCAIPRHHQVLRRRRRSVLRLGHIQRCGGACFCIPMLEYWNVCAAWVLISYLNSGLILGVPVHLHMEAHFVLL